jgi:hypothetical protein
MTRWIYNYLCNQCLSPLTLWVPISLRRYVVSSNLTEAMHIQYNIWLCVKVSQWFARGQWFSLGTLVTSTNKTDRYIRYNWNIVESGIKQLMVIGTDCIGSCKSNYHTITTTTAWVALIMSSFHIKILYNITMFYHFFLNEITCF